MKIIFWFSITTIVYVYIGYPLLIFILSLFYKKPVRGKYVYPKVSILISAYNEEKNIENKIKALLDADYPDERIEILIGSDGSTDTTNKILEGYTNAPVLQPSREIKIFIKNEREGKSAMLNLLAERAQGEILVFTDARQKLDKNALKELVKHFGDQKVGSVSAALFYENENHENKTSQGIGLYWRYEKFIRKSESRMGSMLGATGALYAIRKELFPVLPKNLILDDVYIPMRIVEKGYRAIFDSKAKVFDRIFKNPKEEFVRRVRTLAGNYQLFFYLGHLFNPLKGKISWQFFSHKFLRLLVPFLLVIVFISNMFIVGGALYNLLFILQVIFYALSLMGLILKRKNKFFDTPYMFCVMNVAAIAGLYKVITNKQEVTWEKSLGD
jgi:cellulose synthase/poly-beta-1,6-N-acetylglucosamine synthase-like glycosyltransferase